MFIKVADKKDTTTGKNYRYYKLCQSYRIGEKTRHRTLLVLGKLPEIQSDSDRKTLADRIEYHLSGAVELFPVAIPDHVEELAIHFSRQIQRQGFEKKDLYNPDVLPIAEQANTDFQHVDLSSIELEDVREIGSEWLCKQALEELGLDELLTRLHWSAPQMENALIHIISKASYPCSEHKTAQWISDNTSVTELFGRQPDSINRFDLYRASKMLFAAKADIEKHLSTKTNQLFDLEDKIILYDLTNTYFEGRKAGSKLAKFGRGKEKRSDAKIIALALVVNIEGFVKYSRIYRGNMADCKTLQETLNDLSRNTSFTQRKPTVVIDAGIATEENLKMLKSTGYQYVAVSRSKLKDYEYSENSLVYLNDKRHNPIEVCWATNSELSDQYLRVRSQMKAVKETSMSDHFCDRYEEELDTVSRAIYKKGGTKKYGKVMERIGRIKERYPAANKHYEIEVKEKDGLATEVTWKRKPMDHPSAEGVYFIRTSLEQNNETMVWDIYNTIRQIEEVFRIFKTDLALRPVFHKNDDHTMSHLFLAIVAYSIVNTVRFRLKKQGINHSWSKIIRIMNTQKAGTVTMNKDNGTKVHVRICSKPNQEAQNIYKIMGYKLMPFHRKKFVFPEF
jgi:hypothetical protein